MGWSCSAVAGDVMDVMSNKSYSLSRSQNIYSHKGKWYMWETSRKEHQDGSITGSILEFEKDPRGQEKISARRVSSFKIDGKTGKVKGGKGITLLARGQ